MLNVNAHGVTDCGLQRDYNEDGFGCWVNEGLFVVCDGMGGARSGEVPMEIGLAAIHEAFGAEFPPQGYRSSAPRGLERLNAAVLLANARIVEKAQSARQFLGIGAVVAALSFEGEKAFVAHVGDSRVYRYRAGILEALTRDHSLVNDYHRYKPDATEEEIAAIPKNVLTRALGMREDVEVALYHERAFVGDLYLLCTDGIHTMIDDTTIAKILSKDTNIIDLGKSLFDAAMNAGGADNVAMVLVRCSAE